MTSLRTNLVRSSLFLSSIWASLVSCFSHHTLVQWCAFDLYCNTNVWCSGGGGGGGGFSCVCKYEEHVVDWNDIKHFSMRWRLTLNASVYLLRTEECSLTQLQPPLELSIQFSPVFGPCFTLSCLIHCYPSSLGIWDPSPKTQLQSPLFYYTFCLPQLNFGFTSRGVYCCG